MLQLLFENLYTPLLKMLQPLFEHLCTLEALRMTIILTLSTLIAMKFLWKDDLSKYPLINGKRPWELFYSNQKSRFVSNAKGLIEEGFARVSGCSEEPRIQPPPMLTCFLNSPTKPFASWQTMGPTSSSLLNMQMRSRTTKIWTLVGLVQKWVRRWWYAISLKIYQETHANIPGFEPFKQGTLNDEIFHDAVRLHLTQALGSFAKLW